MSIMAQRLVVVGRDRIKMRGSTAATNTVTLVSSAPVPKGLFWRITNLAVACGSTVLTPSAAVYLKAEQDTANISDIDGVDFAFNSAQRNSQHYARGLIGYEGEFLIVRFTNADNNSICVANAQLEVCASQSIELPERLSAADVMRGFVEVVDA